MTGVALANCGAVPINPATGIATYLLTQLLNGVNGTENNLRLSAGIVLRIK